MATNQQRREAAKRKLERQLVRRAERAKRRRIITIGSTIAAVIVLTGVVVFFATRNNENANAAPDIAIPSERTPEPQRPQPLANPVTCEYPANPAEPAAKQVNAPTGGSIASTGTVNVVLHSTAGDIPVTLNRALAPCAVNNFISLAQQNFYTDSECHRLGTSGLQMLQCGDPQGTGMGGPGYTFNDEVFPELQYGRGILAMANAGPNTNGSQFFMVYGDAPLTPDYTVFGSISDAGLAVLDKVARDGVDATSVQADGTGKPKTPVKFTGATVDNA